MHSRVLQSRSANHYTYMYMYTCLASGLLLSSLCVVKACVEIYVCQLADISPEASAPMVLFLELASHICNRLFAMYMYVVTIQFIPQSGKPRTSNRRNNCYTPSLKRAYEAETGRVNMRSKGGKSA